MKIRKPTSLELSIIEALWRQERLSIREIQESFPARDRLAYSTIQTTVYRMEENGMVKRIRKIGNAHIFSASMTREDAGSSLPSDLMRLFAGRPKFVMAHKVESGDLTLDDIREAEKLLRERGTKRND